MSHPSITRAPGRRTVLRGRLLVPRADSLRGRLAFGAVWCLIGTALSQGSIILASVISARLLDTVGFGELGIINSTIGMFGVFAGFGLGMTATKYVAELRATDPARAGRIIALSSVVAFATGSAMTLALAIFAPVIAARAGRPALDSRIPHRRAVSLLQRRERRSNRRALRIRGVQVHRLR